MNEPLNKTTFKPIHWDSKKVSNFWNYIENSETHREDYFTKYFSQEIINFLKYLVKFEGIILDYGCGPGYLIESLLAKQIYCEGCDFSSESVTFVNKKFANNPNWKGAKLIESSVLPYEDNSLDLIICVETIEHILDEFLTDTLQEFHRILKPKTGRLFITTPNNENLEKNTVYCAECSSVFHRYQHLRTFNIDTLTNLMTSQGFQTQLCNATDFEWFQSHYIPSFLDWSLRQRNYILKTIGANFIESLNLYDSFLGQFLFRKRLKDYQKHLFWIGGK